MDTCTFRGLGLAGVGPLLGSGGRGRSTFARLLVPAKLACGFGIDHGQDLVFIGLDSVARPTAVRTRCQLLYRDCARDGPKSMRNSSLLGGLSLYRKFFTDRTIGWNGKAAAPFSGAIISMLSLSSTSSGYASQWKRTIACWIGEWCFW